MNKLILIVVILLLIPLIAMEFTTEVNWNLFDFLASGALFFGTGQIIIFGIRKIKNIKYRILFCVFVLIFFLLFYVELAVGILR
jgi:hypothetical protein